MKAFGPPWGLVVKVQVVSTPVGQLCAWCDLPFKEGDQGLIIPCLTEAGEWEPKPWHRECHTRSIMGCPAHIQGEGNCANGHHGAVNAPQTPQEIHDEALAVWRLVMGS